MGISKARQTCNPSSSEPWTGKFVIQAKHTRKSTATCSDSSFTTIINKEIPRIKSLARAGAVDNYLLFTNRSAAGEATRKIIEKIKSETGVKNVDLIAKETIANRLPSFSHIVRRFKLDFLREPLRFYEKDLRDVILIFAQEIPSLPTASLSTIHSDFLRIPLEEKNAKNRLSEASFLDIKEVSLPYFAQVTAFLQNPINEMFERYYSNTANELKIKITTHRDEFDEFSHVLEYLYNYLLDRHEEVIKEHRALIYLFLHYMYWHCDIGHQ